MRESTIEKYLVRRAIQSGAQVRKVRWIGRRGAPDRLILWPKSELSQGFSDWIELKSTAGQLSPAQVREHHILRMSGQSVLTLCSKLGVDWYIGVRRP